MLERGAISDEDRDSARAAIGSVPFLFFTDADTGRGNLRYRRYDGDLGLIQSD